MKVYQTACLFIKRAVDLDFIPPEDANEDVLTWSEEDRKKFAEAMAAALLFEITEKSEPLDSITRELSMVGVALKEVYPDLSISLTPCIEMLEPENI